MFEQHVVFFIRGRETIVTKSVHYFRGYQGELSSVVVSALVSSHEFRNQKNNNCI